MEQKRIVLEKKHGRRAGQASVCDFSSKHVLLLPEAVLQEQDSATA